MTVHSIAVPPDPRRDARARVLSGQVPTWPRFTLKQAWGAFPIGTVFRRASSSKGDGRYLVNAVACQCPDYAQYGNVCKHIRAVILHDAAQRPRAASTAPIRRYEDIYPSCRAAGCDDDRAGGSDFCHRHVLVDAF